MKKKGFGTTPVFYTAISSILGAILFLRFGMGVGNIGLLGSLLIILLGHLVTIPTAMAISEIATNQKVEGGGEYFIISRSFGLNIGATIGIALYLSQAISVAFYVIAFTEAFSFFFEWMANTHYIELPRQVISIPAMLLLSTLMLTKGANLGVKALYIVVGILVVCLFLFFAGSTDYSETSNPQLWKTGFRNMDDFFVWFAIIFPAFTGMTAGVGLSGDLEKPSKSIPLGTVSATVLGMIIYIFIAIKLANCASLRDLASDQMIMAKIAIFGFVAIPVGLAASTISSALGSIMVAPRTLQALASDKSLPNRRFNIIFARGKGENKEPFAATLMTCILAFVFVAWGEVDTVAQVISMFFMLTYGALCLISFLYHFGADPSYRPSFKSRWYVSLIGFLACVWLMFMINALYAIVAFVLMIGIYFIISYIHKSRGGLESIFQGAVFQLNRRLHLFLQSRKEDKGKDKWRPAAICISRDELLHNRSYKLLTWISEQYGFGTFVQYIEGYYSRDKKTIADQALEANIQMVEQNDTKIYVGTIINPSYNNTVAQAIQSPSITGKANNIVIFDFDLNTKEGLEEITENIPLVEVGGFDTIVYGGRAPTINFSGGIHVWLKITDNFNANFQILLSYVILGHPDWKGQSISIFYICKEGSKQASHDQLKELVIGGRLPIQENNLKIIERSAAISSRQLINEHSKDAGLTIIGFRAEEVKNQGTAIFDGYDDIQHLLKVHSTSEKKL